MAQEEEIKKIAKRYAQDELKDNHAAVEDVVAAAFLNGIDYAQHHPHWTSVEDELPENYREVIIAISHHFCYTAFRCGDKWYLNDNLNTRELPSATHWMHLPKMPVLSNFENTGKDLKGGEV